MIILYLNKNGKRRYQRKSKWMIRWGFNHGWDCINSISRQYSIKRRREKTKLLDGFDINVLLEMDAAFAKCRYYQKIIRNAVGIEFRETFTPMQRSFQLLKHWWWLFGLSITSTSQIWKLLKRRLTLFLLSVLLNIGLFQPLVCQIWTKPTVACWNKPA